MRSSPEKNPTISPLQVLFASMVLLVLQFIPLESPRPKTASSGYYLYQSNQDINAWLWQDPFTALPQHD
jgi:hypothetical protein